MFKKVLLFLITVIISLQFISCAPKSQNNSNNGGDNGNLSSNLVNIDLFTLNDMHGNVKDTNGLSIAKMTSYLEKQKSYNDNTFFLSSGDMWQGSSESNNTKGQLVTDWMNLLGFSSMTLGNHEFDWGKDAIADNGLLAEFPLLAINVYEKETDQIADFCSPSVLVETDDITFGIIGAIGDCYSSISYSKVSDYYFKVGDDLTNLVKEESNSLKEQGAQFIVYSLHDGYGSGNTATVSNAPVYNSNDLSSFYDVSLSDGYVDLVFEGHTHQSYLYKDKYGVFHMQASSSNKAVAHVDMDYDKGNDKLIVNKIDIKSTSAFSSLYEEDEKTNALFDKYSEQIGAVYEVLGQNAYTKNANYLKQLCANLYLEKGLKKWGNDYDIFIGGGFISCRNPYYLYSGDVCYADIQSLFPFDNDLVLCSVSGYYLKKQFTTTSNSNYYIAYSEYGKLNQDNILDNKTYYIVTDTYSSDYAPNHLEVIEYYSLDGIFARDLIAEYVKAGGLA